MGLAKRMWEKAQLEDPNNWITRECCVCNTNVKLNKVLDREDTNFNEPFTCNSCMNKD